jgi:4-amino-4-deoxy-L-arabinose transferase-like glycosyltransferase
MTIKPYLGFILLIVIAAIPLFIDLDAAPILQWDEARLATSALEMNHNNNWLVVKYSGHPDMWSTKPPLMIWLQVLMMKVIGINELAVRLPAALAAMGTCMLLFWFFVRKYKEPLMGLMSAVVLVSMQGYVTFHGTRTGDYDSLLTMFSTGSCFSWLLYLGDSRRKYLYATFIFLILAALTKGIQGLIFLPGLFICTLYQKKLLSTLRQKEFYAGIALFLVIVVGYYLLRDHYNPGYIRAVMQNELGGRYTTVLESHAGSRWYYLYKLINEQLPEWVLLMIPAVLLGLISKERWIKEITVYSSVLVLTYLIAISGAKTKLDWYTMPLYPFLSVFIAVFLHTICKLLAKADLWNQVINYNVLPFIFIFLVLVGPYRAAVTNSLEKRHLADVPQERVDMEQFMKNVLHHERNIDGCTLLDDGNLGQNILWYYWAIAQQHHVKLSKQTDISEDEKLVTFHSDSKKFIEGHYYTQTIQTFNNVIVYQLLGKKQSPAAEEIDP